MGDIVFKEWLRWNHYEYYINLEVLIKVEQKVGHWISIDILTRIKFSLIFWSIQQRRVFLKMKLLV